MSHTHEQEERERFYHSIDARRRALGKSWRQVAAEAGVRPNIPTRIGRGEEVLSGALFRLSAWLHATRQGNGGLLRGPASSE